MTETDVVQNYPTNFEAWIEEFNDWQTRIGFDPSWLGDYRFDIKFDWDTAGGEIEFGDFEGMPKWERRMQIPQQNITDAIITMVSVQGDTEFASVEQQNHLLETAPTEYDKKSALRIMCALGKLPSFSRGTHRKEPGFSGLSTSQSITGLTSLCSPTS